MQLLIDVENAVPSTLGRRSIRFNRLVIVMFDDVDLLLLNTYLI